MRNAIYKDLGPVVDLVSSMRNSPVMTDDAGKLRTNAKGNLVTNRKLVKPVAFSARDTEISRALTNSISSSVQPTMDTIRSRIQSFSKEHRFGLQRAHSDGHQNRKGSR